MSAFGDALRAVREARRPYLSQSRLARAAGFNHSAVSRWESGGRQPERETVNALADALDATPEERAALMEAAGFAAPVNAYVERFRALPEPVQRAALELIEKVRVA